MKDFIYRAFSVNHRNYLVYHIGDYENKDDADMAMYLDSVDDPSPDKHLFYSWHVVMIHRCIGRGIK